MTSKIHEKLHEIGSATRVEASPASTPRPAGEPGTFSAAQIRLGFFDFARLGPGTIEKAHSGLGGSLAPPREPLARMRWLSLLATFVFTAFLVPLIALRSTSVAQCAGGLVALTLLC